LRSKEEDPLAFEADAEAEATLREFDTGPLNTDWKPKT